MQRPCGVAATPDGSYVVSDYENRCLCVFDPLGKLVRRIGHGKLQGEWGAGTETLSPTCGAGADRCARAV